MLRRYERNGVLRKKKSAPAILDGALNATTPIAPKAKRENLADTS